MIKSNRWLGFALISLACVSNAAWAADQKEEVVQRGMKRSARYLEVGASVDCYSHRSVRYFFKAKKLQSVDPAAQHLLDLKERSKACFSQAPDGELLACTHSKCAIQKADGNWVSVSAFKDANGLSAHWLNHEKNLKCGYCGALSRSRSSFNRDHFDGKCQLVIPAVSLLVNLKHSLNQPG